jgi:hypothetical protein
MEMDDGGTGCRGAQGGVGNLFGSDRQMRRHRWSMDGTGNGAGDDDGASVGHEAGFL